MWRPEFETHGIKDIDDFARKVFEGKFSYGDIKLYNKSGIFSRNFCFEISHTKPLTLGEITFFQIHKNIL